MHSATFKQHVALQQRAVTVVVHRHLFGPPSESAREQLESLDAIEDSNLDAEDDNRGPRHVDGPRALSRSTP